MKLSLNLCFFIDMEAWRSARRSNVRASSQVLGGRGCARRLRDVFLRRYDMSHNTTPRGFYASAAVQHMPYFVSLDECVCAFGMVRRRALPLQNALGYVVCRCIGLSNHQYPSPPLPPEFPKEC